MKIGIAREIGNVWFPVEAVKSFLKMHLFDAAKNIIQYTRSNNVGRQTAMTGLTHLLLQDVEMVPQAPE